MSYWKSIKEENEKFTAELVSRGVAPKRMGRKVDLVMKPSKMRKHQEVSDEELEALLKQGIVKKCGDGSVKWVSFPKFYRCPEGHWVRTDNGLVLRVACPTCNIMYAAPWSLCISKFADFNATVELAKVGRVTNIEPESYVDTAFHFFKRN